MIQLQKIEVVGQKEAWETDKMILKSKSRVTVKVRELKMIAASALTETGYLCQWRKTTESKMMKI